jgi:hypothetical protein
LAPAPLDPGRDWLAAGITGLARQREWDAVATLDAPGQAGEEVEFVVLVDNRLIVERGSASVEPRSLAAALEGSIDPPFRALALRRSDFWAVGASAIDVVRLGPSTYGDDLELTWDGTTLELVADGIAADPSKAAALERLASVRARGPYAANAHRLEGDLFEISVMPI